VPEDLGEEGNMESQIVQLVHLVISPEGQAVIMLALVVVVILLLGRFKTGNHHKKDR
jgi:hypothetical protein